MILQYTGLDYCRFYLTKKCKRSVWKVYFSKSDEAYSRTVGALPPYDFGDLRRIYKKLFSQWENHKRWQEADAFLDDLY